MLSFSLCNKKRLTIRHMNRPPLSNDTIDSVLRHWEGGRAKDLSTPLRNWYFAALRTSLRTPFEGKILEDFNMYLSPWRPDSLHSSTNISFSFFYFQFLFFSSSSSSTLSFFVTSSTSSSLPFLVRLPLFSSPLHYPFFFFFFFFVFSFLRSSL